MVRIGALMGRALGWAVVAACAFSLAVATPAAASPKVGAFQRRASTPNPVNNVVVDPTTNLIYAQQYSGTGFYRYNPRTNRWKTLASAPLNQGNNGGAAYLKGKIYTVYTENASQMGMYNVATGKWKTIANPLGLGTGDITAVGGLLYLVNGFTFISFNPATHTTHTLKVPPFSFDRWAGLAPYKGKVYGQQGDCSCDSRLAAYDIATNKWKQLPKLPAEAVLGAAIDPVAGIFYAYGSYSEDHFYRYDIKTGKWLSNRTFPHPSLDDGGLTYVSTPKLQGIYATYGQNSDGFTRYVTKPASHHH